MLSCTYASLNSSRKRVRRMPRRRPSCLNSETDCTNCERRLRHCSAFCDRNALAAATRGMPWGAQMKSGGLSAPVFFPVSYRAPALTRHLAEGAKAFCVRAAIFLLTPRSSNTI